MSHGAIDRDFIKVMADIARHRGQLEAADDTWACTGLGGHQVARGSLVLQVAKVAR